MLVASKPSSTRPTTTTLSPVLGGSAKLRGIRLHEFIDLLMTASMELRRASTSTASSRATMTTALLLVHGLR